MTAALWMQWIDLIWVPVALLVTERGLRLKTAIFAGSCVLLLRFQVELLQSLGWNNGLIGLMESPILIRGQLTYGAFVFLFLVLSFFSKGVDKHVHIAAAITMMITAFCVSTMVMVL